MAKKFILSVVVLFVVTMLIGITVHAVLLKGDYAALPNLMRPEAEAGQYMGYMIAADLLIAIGFTWIYVRGKENKPWFGQGLRFGLAIAVVSTIPIYLIYHAVSPFPFDLVIKQIVYDTIGMMVMGIVVAAINR
jgi:hypothetical protein